MNNEFIENQLVKIREASMDSLINKHIERMWGGLEMASIQHFMDKGKVSGSFYLALKEMMRTAYGWNKFDVENDYQITGKEPVSASQPQPERIPESTMANLSKLSEITGCPIDGIVAGWWVRFGEVQTLQIELEIYKKCCENDELW